MHLIPAVAHPFYEKLKGNGAVKEDIEGFNGELDFEIDILWFEVTCLLLFLFWLSQNLSR